MRLSIRAHDLSVKGEEALIRALGNSGADGVQLVCYKSFADVPHAPGGMNEALAARIGGALAKAKVSVVLLGAYFNPVHSDPAKVQDGMAIFADYLRCGAALGCGIVGSETGSCSDEPWVYHPQNRTEASLSLVVERFASLCKTAAQYGAFVGIEGAAGHVCWNVATLQRAYERIGCENLRIIFDLYNYLDQRNCRDYYDILCEGLETFGSRICCFHLKDCVFENGTFRQVPLGRGELDYNRIFGAIRKHNESATLIMEGTTGGDIPYGAAYIRKKWREATL
ncbi:MAG: sugar phosphate isomerase/epimerase [Clostridia bacterium]|nr:sugar phosphate isomerase/epimerase [Clostridia bacterium]